MKFWTALNGSLVSIELPVSRFVVEESKIRGREKSEWTIFAIYEESVEVCRDENTIATHKIVSKKEEVVTRKSYLEALEDLYSMAEKLNRYERTWEV